MTLTITACPICGGDLQATEVRHVWFSLSHAIVTEGPSRSSQTQPDQAVATVERDEEADDDRWYGEDTVSRSIYCENDHTAEEMAAAMEVQR